MTPKIVLALLFGVVLGVSAMAAVAERRQLKLLAQAHATNERNEQTIAELTASLQKCANDRAVAQTAQRELVAALSRGATVNGQPGVTTDCAVLDLLRPGICKTLETLQAAHR